MVDFMKKIWFSLAMSLLCSASFASPPVYGPLQAQNNLDDVDSASISLANLGGAPINNPTFTGTVTLGGGILSISGTNTGTADNGLVIFNDPSWTPPATSGVSAANNSYESINISNVGLTGGTVQQRWNTTNFINGAYNINVTGPTGTPSSPSGMADSHTLGNYVNINIPAGLCDGQNGNGFSGPGGSPGNNCYQELGGDDVQLSSQSPGYLLEGMSSQEFDDEFGTLTAVPTVMTGYTAGIHKDYAGNTYVSTAFIANSIGTQQTTFAPTNAYQIAGGWQYGINFTAGTYNTCEIAWLGGQCTTSSASNVTLNLGATDFSLVSSLNGSALEINDSGTSGSTLEMVGNGATTPIKYIQVSNGQFNILNNAANADILSLTDAGNLKTTGSINPSTTAGIIGTTLGDNANSGSVGEYVTNSTSGTSISSGNANNSTSESLTAGDWDISCTSSFLPANTTVVTSASTWISTTSASIPTVNTGAENQIQGISWTGNGVGLLDISSPVVRENLSSTTTVYCGAISGFSTSTQTVSGFIRARRVR